MNKNIVIGGAWPYANNSLHLGHIASLISGDVLARYHRQIGDNVLYVSGTDCHGTPITERAKKEKITPNEICEKYHKEFTETFYRLNFSYDLYTKTHTEYHAEKVKELFKKLYDNGYIYEKVEKQAYCEKCDKFLQDREIQITCPSCGLVTKADQCDSCLHVPTIEEMNNGTCLECGSTLVQRDNKNLYFALSKFHKEIEENTNAKKQFWRVNAINETEKYLKQGLVDRAVTRDINWGIDIPVAGYENKKMYVWIDAVLGYLTDTMKLAEENGFNWEEYWKEGYNNKIYMTHGKDNIVFHSIIFNALLLGQKENFRMVDVIVSSEYLNINDDKISKSKGNGITALDMLEKYNSDTLRYHLIANGPENKDTNFTVDSYVDTHNGEVLNKFGNLVNRTLKFKELTEVPNGNLNDEIKGKVEETYTKVADSIEKLKFREAIEEVMALIEYANKYYDETKPWVLKKENIDEFNNVIYNCTFIIANLSNLFEPFMPEACSKLRNYLELDDKASWKVIDVKSGVDLSGVEALFSRVER